MSTFLVVADRLAWSMGLARSLRMTYGGRENVAYVLVVPAEPCYRAVEQIALIEAKEAAARARTSLQLDGMTVLEAIAGDAPPRKALDDEMHRKAFRYDGIVIGVSSRRQEAQIQPDLVQQLQRRYGIPVQLIALQGRMSTEGLHRSTPDIGRAG